MTLIIYLFIGHLFYMVLLLPTLLTLVTLIDMFNDIAMPGIDQVIQCGLNTILKLIKYFKTYD